MVTAGAKLEASAREQAQGELPRHQPPGLPVTGPPPRLCATATRPTVCTPSTLTLRAWSLSSICPRSLPLACAILLPDTRFPTITEAGPISAKKRRHACEASGESLQHAAPLRWRAHPG